MITAKYTFFPGGGYLDLPDYLNLSAESATSSNHHIGKDYRIPEQRYMAHQLSKHRDYIHVA
jgi:hypothetical protein